MKQFLSLSVLAILAIGALGLAAGVTPEPGDSLTVNSSSNRASDSEKERLYWKPLDGPYERVTYALAFVPGAKQYTLHAGTWGHGVYRSQDGGDTWETPGSEGGSSIRTLAALPSDGKTLFAGSSGEGLFVSTNSGAYWHPLGSGTRFTRPSLTSRARNPLYVESLFIVSDVEEERIFVGTHYGVWTSDDFETWEQLDSGFEDIDDAYNVQALAHDPSGWLYAGTLAGLYGRRDGDQAWEPMNPTGGYPDGAHRILSLAVVTDTTHYTGTLLIGTQGAGIYALDVKTREWLTRTTGFPEDKRARTIQVLLSAPAGVVYAGTVDHGVFVSTNGGQDWQPIVEGLPPHALSILSLARDPTDGTVYAGTYGDGVYRLCPGCQGWEPANAGLPVDFAVQEIAFAGPQSERLLAGLRVGGMYLNTDRQEKAPTWQRLPRALPIGPARDVAGLAVSGPDRTKVVIAAGTGIFRSTDAGETWRHLGDSKGSPPAQVRAKALVQGRQNSQVLYVVLEGAKGIYRSDDAGKSWESALGNLEEELIAQFSCLAAGAEDETVYLGLLSGRVFVTQDAGTSWLPLSPISVWEVLGLDWGQRSAWDVFLHGGQRRMLYARTSDGVYVSYDEGESWQLRQRGTFDAMLADPHRPGVVYVASPAAKVETGFAPQDTRSPELWISYDGGETWKWAGASPEAITTLALDPTDTDLLFAGTEGGVFRARLPSVQRSYTIGALALTAVSVLLLIGLFYVIWTGLPLWRRYGLPPQTWPELAYLRARYGSEMSLVSARHTPLTSLQRLVLALAPHGSFRPEALWQQLEEREVPADPAQTELALKKLALDYHLLRSAEGSYWHLSALLGRMARARFWDAPEERTRLIEAVRGESLVRADIRRFFKLAGFDASSFEDGFTVRSNRPEYALLGAGRGIYVHLHPATELDLGQVREAQENANRAYEGLLAGKIAYLIVGDHPEVETWQHIIDLGQEEDFRPVLLSYNRIRHTAEATTSRQMLARSLQRALGHVDLFQLHGPARDPLDFFGRETALQTLVEACRDGQVTGLAGMAQVGKTSLAWQVMDRLPGALIAWIDLNDAPTEGLYAALRQLWLDKARVRFSTWEPPRLASPPERPTPAQIVADLGAIRDSLSGQAPAVHLVAVLDGLAGLSEPEELEALAQAVAEVAGVSLLGVFDARPKGADAFQMLPVRPLELRESAALVNSLAAQMALAFDPAATDRLHEASGGHPLLLRQLASLAVAHEGGVDGRIDAADVDHAVTRYVSQPESGLSLLWDSLTGGEQGALGSAISVGPPPADDVLTTLVELGWLKQVDGGWRLFSQALDGWLRSQLPYRG